MKRKQYRDKLDKILKHTKFSHKTKALWAYYQGLESVKTYKPIGLNRVERVIMLNFRLNGAITAGLHDHSFRPETIAHWTHAIRLIDIAAHQKIDHAARRHFQTVPALRLIPPYRRGF